MFVVFVLALAVNFLIIAVNVRYVERHELRELVRKLVIPVLSSEVFAACWRSASPTSTSTSASPRSRCSASCCSPSSTCSASCCSPSSARRSWSAREQLTARTKQLASLQVGVLCALLRTLDLRDRMTARHCAAVARYAREIAIAAGFSKDEQDLVHTAGLLHDIGKFIFPDRILKGDTKLTDDDWKIIKMHPYQGARVVAQIEGYGPVSEIILAHHERIDGKGYPRGLRGNDIPALSRMISVADTYDVMTARDSYRKPISSFEAIQELRRVSGTQLDAEYVEIFIQHPRGQGRPLPPRRGRRLRRRAGPRQAHRGVLAAGRPRSPRMRRHAVRARRRSLRRARRAPRPTQQVRLERALSSCGRALRRHDVHALAGAELEARQAGSGAARRRRASGSARPAGRGADPQVERRRAAELRAQLLQASAAGRAPPGRRREAALVAPRHELQLVGPAGRERRQQHGVVVDRDDALAAAHLFLQQVAQQAAAHGARVVRGEALALARDQRGHEVERVQLRVGVLERCARGVPSLTIRCT